MAYYKRYRKLQRQLQELFSSSEDEENYTSSKVSKLHDAKENTDMPYTLPYQQLIDDNIICSSEEESGTDSDSQPELKDSINDDSVLEELAKWASENNIKHQAIGQLLEILNKRGLNLPKDARTLLQTPRHVTTVEKCGGRYSYFGMASCLQIILNRNKDFTENNDFIKLSVNVDGIPLYKSSNEQFWPILIKFSNFRPALVALYCGKTKPEPVESFLEDFLGEYMKLSKDGLFVDGKRLGVEIISFICDAPARAFLKCIKGHTGYYACERCEIKGTWDSNVVILDSKDKCRERTDEKFNLGHYEGTHQRGISPLIQYGISCVKGFPLDYMHLICLGVTRRMLLFLMRGPRVCKLSQHQLSLVSAALKGMSNRLPSEFARQPRSLALIDRWKATEFRQFILYTSIIAMKDIVSAEIYKTSLSLTVALSILLNSNNYIRNGYLSYARELLEYFVQQCHDVFGPHFVVYNVHNVIHLADDVESYQCSLNSLSAFPFENHLYKIKKLVRSTNNPISQVFKRLAEKERYSATKDTSLETCISTKYKDNYFLLESEDFVFLKEVKDNGYYTCDVLSQSLTEYFFTEPCDSKLINIVFMKNTSRTKIKVIHSKQLFRKVVKLPYKDGVVLIPFLHDKTE